MCPPKSQMFLCNVFCPPKSSSSMNVAQKFIRIDTNRITFKNKKSICRIYIQFFRVSFLRSVNGKVEIIMLTFWNCLPRIIKMRKKKPLKNILQSGRFWVEPRERERNEWDVKLKFFPSLLSKEKMMGQLLQPQKKAKSVSRQNISMNDEMMMWISHRNFAPFCFLFPWTFVCVTNCPLGPFEDFPSWVEKLWKTRIFFH